MARLAALSFLATGAVAVQSGVYKLQTKYDLDTFFDNFDFYTVSCFKRPAQGKTFLTIVRDPTQTMDLSCM
jgi:hypothetical protein